MPRIKPVLAVILSLVTLFGGIAWADTLILNTGTRNPYTTEDRQGFLDQLIGELFRRVDLQAEVLVYDASARALANANNGIDAGVAMRIKGLERKYPNLVMVPEKVIDNDFVAYSLQYDFQITEWNSLTPHLVGHILGWQIFERNMPQATLVEKAIGPEQLFLLLEKGRVDVILYERWQGLWRAGQLSLDVRVHEPPLAQRAMYIYLHKHYAHLVDRVSAELAAMKQDGSYQAIVDRTLTPLLPPE
ncbi:MAG: transporter substrate-binding domain-containing protein [Sedimenticola sp.]